MHIDFTRADGSPLTTMSGWEMAVPNQKDGTLEVEHDRRPTDPPFFTVGASFVAPSDEHYYGLGQNHEGRLDHRGQPITCEANYLAPAGASWCVPLLVTNKGYGILWDNPSSTVIEPAFNDQTRWISKVGQRVSYFVIAGRTTDEIYEGYRLLSGATPMLPKAAYGRSSYVRPTPSSTESIFRLALRACSSNPVSPCLSGSNACGSSATRSRNGFIAITQPMRSLSPSQSHFFRKRQARNLQGPEISRKLCVLPSAFLKLSCSGLLSG